MGRDISAFMPMVPPTVTHNDLVPCTRGGRPSIRKGERLLEAEAKLMAHMGGLAERARDSGGPLAGALALRVTWCFPKGAAHAQGEPHTAKPDMSNMLKTLEDCLTRSGIIADDALICSEHLAKAWSDPAGIYVEVREL